MYLAQFATLLAVSCCIVGAVLDSAEDVFVRWFTQNGGSIGGLELTQFPRMGRGFKATKAIQPKDQILYIPHELIFSTKNLAKNVDDRTRKVLETLGTDGALYAWLLLEKRNATSFFKPYLDILPSYVSSLVYFDEMELAELQSAQLVKESIDMQDSARADYEAFMVAYSEIMKQRGTPVTAENTVPYAEYLWAMSMFNSRGLRFQGPVYMAPMADIFNYQAHPAPRAQFNGDFFAKHHRLDASGITILSDRAHEWSEDSNGASGDHLQVFEDYGDNSDEIYFKYHGFVPDENPFRCVTLGVDEVVADLVAASPAAASTNSAQAQDKSLLPGASEAHKAMFAALEFNRLPSKCVDALVPAPLGTAKIGGYFGKGLEVLLILLSLTEAEAAHCVEYVQSTTIPAAKGKAATKNWPGIFKECGFSAAEAYLQKVRSEGIETASAMPIPPPHKELVVRALQTVQRFLELSLQRDAMTTGIAEDAILLATLQAQLDASFTVPTLHRLLAVKYRLHRKQLLLGITTQYGATEGVRRLQGKAVQDPAVAPWDAAPISTGTVDSDATDSANPPAPLPFDAPLSEKIRAFNAWFTSLSPIPCHIAAMEIPEFRLGTIATRPIKKGEVYLGISTSHGGIMDADTALKGKHSGVAPLLARLIEAYPKRDDFHELLFFLLYETFVQREQSFYWPYLSLLPTLADMEGNAFVPLLWAEEDIKTRLGPSDVAGLITDYHAKTKTRFASLLKMAQITDFFANATAHRAEDKSAQDKTAADVFTFRNYQWATVILDSRAIWWNGKRHLVPMLDFVNCQEHAQDRALLHSTVLDETGRYAITKSGRDFSAGEQLFENYGQPNHIYFTYHGFLLQNNSHDCVHLELPLTAQDLKSMNVQKAAPILQKLRLSPNKPSVLPVCLTYPVAPMVWAFMAVKTHTFEKLHEQDLLGRENLPGTDALVALLDNRLAAYAAFERSDHLAASRLLEAEVAHLTMVRDKLLLDRVRLGAPIDAKSGAVDMDDEL